ncbi:MAG TPA: PAS domain S-box protein, partial [Candidatus Cloacimonas acidaminovorans]|nr:PAS domain S-box protein [Candidatus Cloacimonas acidaminovorans]
MKSLLKEDLYAKIFHSALLAIAVTDKQGNFIAVNPAWCKALGWTEE